MRTILAVTLGGAINHRIQRLSAVEKSVYFSQNFFISLGQTFISCNALQVLQGCVVVSLGILHQLVKTCRDKSVKFNIPAKPTIIVQGDRIKVPPNLISVIQARRLIKKKHQAYLAFVRDTQLQCPPLDRILVVREFFDIFPEELLGLPPN
ncbi:RVP_2 domain-containing protein [Quillaja saponaria]|uniref:RVP_2 domain-containing protein n=1 Tax=Quillaja saponaria TaxID=32244 RepID=A0AAD7P9K2_QUISA|nr:RVP_2 domain-containing protein [Quillaja saponaria]